MNTIPHTQRLSFEMISGQHAEEMLNILQDERIYRYMPEEPPVTVQALKKRFEFLAGGKSPDGHDRAVSR